MPPHTRPCLALILSLVLFGMPALGARGPGFVGGVNAEVATPIEGGEFIAELNGVLQQGLDDGLTGISVAIYREGLPPSSMAVGLAKREDETPLEPTDRLRVYSVMKTFTAVLTLQLVDDGVLELNDTVTKWLDDPVVARIPNVDRITIRHLLTHTSGVYDYYNGPDSSFVDDAFFAEDADWSRNWTPQELLAYVDGTKQAPSFAPGQGVGYSDTGYILLGLIVEQAGGQSVTEQLHSRILEPLGLVDTFLAASEPVPGGVVAGYHRLEGEMVDVSAINLSWAWTQGGLVSTADDLARFADALFGDQLLTQASLKEMLTFLPADEQGREWGMGLARLQTPAGAMIGMNGSGPGFAARMYQLPDGSIAVLLTNANLEDDTVNEVFAQVVALTLAAAD